MGGMVWIRSEVRQVQGTGSVAFSLDLDPEHFDLSAIDTDADGIPDHLRYPQGQPHFRIVRWNADDSDGELDILLADLVGDSLVEGGILEVGVPGNQWLHQGLMLSDSPRPSFGSTTGSDLVGTTNVDLSLFADDFESGGFTRWSQVVE